MKKVEYLDKDTVVYAMNGLEVIEYIVKEVEFRIDNDFNCIVKYKLKNTNNESFTWKNSNQVFDSKDKLKAELLKQFV